MPSTSPLDPKATTFAPRIASPSSQQKLNPKAPVFLPSQQLGSSQQAKIMQGLVQQLQASYDSYPRVFY
jgi:hypothetical protein